jgi:hypothetical protein
MPARDQYGIEYDLAYDDGEILDMRVVSLDEFLDAWGDHFEGTPSEDAVLEFARTLGVDHLIDWPLAPLHEQYGVSRY